ncbi:alpha/beta fold hydrolase [Streptomyces sp. SID10815]|uniref:alpha/beta fold hydrolase n=1 Tax=Streptomyces sp. SID10815 TaxID=2706027 RepID=UPI0013C8B049|nr:alpha/beta fold hydrolase [Streptomyces sp. SID10815]NEA46481.1 alpha/beta fold hydrolase [Streptomyces sp. SID10815]
MVRGTDGGAATAALWVRRLPERPRVAVITLHGGREDGYQTSQPWHLAALRMRPVLRAAGSALRPDEAVLGQVRYRHRGWNREDPLQDAYRALDELDRLAGPVPVVLIGHSMGGRAALRAAAHPRVSAVVALAPWVPADEPTTHLAGKRIVVLHGSRDTVTSPGASLRYVRRARGPQTRAGIVLIGQGDHAMLRRARLWHRCVAELVADLTRPEEEPTGLAATSYAATRPLLL